jgi:hypothetical protein
LSQKYTLNINRYITIVVCFIFQSILGQHEINIDARLDSKEGSIHIAQEIQFYNTSKDTLNEIFLNDWANSFSSKTTPLAKRFNENYNSSFHFEKKKDRGRTDIVNILDVNMDVLSWDYEDVLDIIRVELPESLAPNESVKINLEYKVKLPNDKFTRFGVTQENDYKLKYWYIAPAMYDEKWHAYSNKNIRDHYAIPSNFTINFKYPKNYTITTDLDIISEINENGQSQIQLKGDQRMGVELYLFQYSIFEHIQTDKIEVITNLKNKINPAMCAVIVDRIVHFLDERLGDYPFDKMVISESNYKNSPVYGLNQLPNFISPFPDGFEYDMEQLKTITRKYIENSLVLNPRNDHWLMGSLHIYLMMEYVNKYYPKMKIIGNLSNQWIVKWSHASDLEFNDQYPFLYLNMARNNLHQPLTTPKDSLVKFNKKIASDYYGGTGLNYLSDYIGKEELNSSIKEFYQENLLKPIHSSIFQNYIEQNTSLPVNWFFENYIDSRKTIDFKIKKVTPIGDFLEVEILNKRANRMPVSLYGLNKDRIVFKKWLPPIDSTFTINVPANDVRKLALNYEAIIPEFNQRNNYKKIKGLLNRPLQFRFFKDIEDPKYNQVFFMPTFQYNFYDGFSLGPKIYNKTIIPKGFHYRLEPQYGFKSQNIVGKGSLVYTLRPNKKNIYYLRFGVNGSHYAYNEGLYYNRFSQYMTLALRNEDFRNNKKQFINVRNINVYRDNDELNPEQEPNYNVFNVQYKFSNPNLINHFTNTLDFQVSSKFSKISTTFEYRRLFLNNRQLNLRLFAGLFLHNNTDINDDYFSFALDRPTDYLFDYNYYGRSESSGLFSQQIIIAEGGFKSKISPSFSNSWIATMNASTNIWKWIYAYGDVGLIHNKGNGTDAVFDTGVRLSFVADYFELYFPLYSSLGWEPGLPGYDERVRFIVTLDLKTLFSLFTREWY